MHTRVCGFYFYLKQHQLYGTKYLCMSSVLTYVGVRVNSYLCMSGISAIVMRTQIELILVAIEG